MLSEKSCCSRHITLRSMLAGNCYPPPKKDKMAFTCEYCHGQNELGSTSCKNCGAPLPTVSAASTADTHRCPNCGRRLLALASPTCNYCGHRLPEEYIRANEANLRRINEINTPLDDRAAHELEHQQTAGTYLISEITKRLLQ